MSATNSTTNYSLPIFIETDKPAWLVDFNGAMRAIDAQMKTNADAIATKSPILTFSDTVDIDLTQSGNIITASLQGDISTKIGRALVTPLSAPANDQLVSIDTNGYQANIDIGSGLDVSNGALTAVDLNLTAEQITLSNIVVETTGFSINTSTGNMAVAKNAAGTVAKIYGRLRVTNSTSANSAVTLRLPVKVAPTGLNDNITISPSGCTLRTTAGTVTTALDFANVIQIAPDGTIRLAGTCPANAACDMFFFPSLYFIKNFGDQA